MKFLLNYEQFNRIEYREECVLQVESSPELVSEMELMMKEMAETMLETDFELALVKAVSSAGFVAAAAGRWKE